MYAGRRDLVLKISRHLAVGPTPVARNDADELADVTVVFDLFVVHDFCRFSRKSSSSPVADSQRCVCSF